GYLARELFQWGSPQSAAYLEAIDRRMQEGLAEPQAVAPIARTFAVGDILLRADLKFERFRTPRPKQMWDLLTAAPGLGEPVAFAEALPVIAGPEQPLVDEIELGQPPDLVDPPLLSAFPVLDPMQIFRAQPVPRPLLVAGDADGLVGAAGAGILFPEQATFLSASYATDAAGRQDLLDRGADLLVTDTNRRRAHRWGALRETTGYTERAGEVPETYDPSDQRLEVFPGATDDAFTVTEHHGATVTATAYGNPITYTPEDRPAMAFDGDPATAWRVGAIDDPTGEVLRIDLDEPVTTDEVLLTQPLTNVRNRWLTQVALRFDGGAPVVVDLDQSSRELPGQRVTFDERTFSTLEVELLADDIGRRPRYDGLSGVGFAEVTIPGATFSELVRPPTDLLDAVGDASADHRLVYQFERQRANPLEPVRADPETSIRRVLDVRTDRRFALSGTARLSTQLPDDEVDRLLGLPDARRGGVTATSSAHLPTNRARASAALDGDLSTAWTSIYDKQEGHWLALDLPEPVTFDSIGLDVLADYVHSVPTRLRIEADGVEVATVDLPDAEWAFERGHTAHLDVPTPQITGSQLRFIIDGVEEATTIDWYTDRPIVLPVGIAELEVADVSVPQPEPWFDSGCRDDLVAVDGRPAPMRIQGPTEEALDGAGFAAEPCTPAAADTGRAADAGEAEPADAPPLDAADVALPAGAHEIAATPGRESGFDLDRLLVASDAEGAPLAGPALTSVELPETPSAAVASAGRTRCHRRRRRRRAVLADLQPILEPRMDGVDRRPGPRSAAGHQRLRQRVADRSGRARRRSRHDGARRRAWAPQRVVWVAVGLSVVALVVCIALLLFARRRPEPVVDTTGVDHRIGGLDPRLVRPDVVRLVRPHGAGDIEARRHPRRRGLRRGAAAQRSDDTGEPGARRPRRPRRGRRLALEARTGSARAALPRPAWVWPARTTSCGSGGSPSRPISCGRSCSSASMSWAWPPSAPRRRGGQGAGGAS
ncbi:MAG: alpha-(1-_3)-arabinofuranosyltransferase family protein, partial [Acidimicrobiales bacterium]